MGSPRRLPRSWLVAWLLTPVVIVGLLTVWLFLGRSRGRPRVEWMHGAPAPASQGEPAAPRVPSP